MKHWYRKLPLAFVLLFSFRCQPGELAVDNPVDGGEAIATYDGGQVLLSEVEDRFAAARGPACLDTRRAEGGGSLEELVPCYRELAEELVLERLLQPDANEVERAEEELGDRYWELRRNVYLQTYHQRQAEQTEVRDEEIAAHFEAHRDRYRRSGSLSLWNIFRRHEDPDNPEETLALLEDLRRRYASGETFAALAQEYSHSETRVRGGQVRRVMEGELPAKLEEIAFSLAEGELSEPIEVAGGAVLLQVRNVVPGSDTPLEEVREMIRIELRREKIADRVRARLDGRDPPASDNALILSNEELLSAIESDEGRVVLQVGEHRLTAAELRQRAGLGPAPRRREEVDGEERDRAEAVYRRAQDDLLLLADLESSGAAEDVAVRDEAEARLKKLVLEELVDRRIAALLEERVAGRSEELERFYEDNPHHYQSPLRFKVHVWDLAFGETPPLQLASMEALRASLVQGEIDLATAVSELGGGIRDLGWRDFASFSDLPDKVRSYLVQVGAGSFSVPYSHDGALHVIWVEDRQEPEPLAFEEVAERVEQDYLARFEVELYRELVDERLGTADFVFREGVLRTLMLPRGATPTPPSGE